MFTATNIASVLTTKSRPTYPQALYSDLIFELTLAPLSKVVKGSDATKLSYKLTNIQLEYEMVRSKTLADEVYSIYTNGRCLPMNTSDQRLNIRIARPSASVAQGNPSSLYTRGARDSEKYFNSDITKVSVTVNGSPNRIYNNGIEGKDLWREISRFISNRKGKSNMS